MLDTQTFYALPESRSNSFRQARFRYFLEMVDIVLARKACCRIIDIGGTPGYWHALRDQIGGRIIDMTIVNKGPQEDGEFGGYTALAGDATNLRDFADNSFDLVHSNSVIEHVGMWRDMVSMAGEVRRLAPAFYVQTPNFWFPYDPHSRTMFFQWLPTQVRAGMLLRKQRGFYEKCSHMDDAMRFAEDARCLTRVEMQELFPDAEVIGEKFMGFVKSWMAIKKVAQAH